ncbi:translation initiation factor IF-3 [bacterium]|nr:translation initiation factor IF-3 [bacterium]
MKIPRINHQIRAKEVRLISENGANLGVFPFEKALQYAKERNLDLIEVSKNAVPPVCKVMDFGKYLYQQKKKTKGQRKKQKIGRLKSVRISPRIAEHDFETKASLVKKFLSKGYRVRIEMFLKGREKALSDFAKEKLEDFLKKISTEMEIKTEGEIKRIPRGMEVIISRK